MSTRPQQPVEQHDSSFDEAAARLGVSARVIEIAREYAESGRVSPGRVAEILGDPNRPVTMKSSANIKALCNLS